MPEFLRLGSSIPGSYWGCCAVCYIQDFKQDPEEPYAIELVDGDGGNPIGDKFAGKTYREMFETRIRIGTFSDEDMPNHAFLAVLTDWQLSTNVGLKWLKILKENGFEFIRAVDNSVYTGNTLKTEKLDSLFEDEDEDYLTEPHSNYIFGLFRNIGNGAIQDPFQPPAEWTNLGGGVLEVSSFLSANHIEQLQASRDEVHLERWNNTKTTFYKRKDLEAEGVPIWLAGRRSTNPQEMAKYREQRNKEEAQAPKAAPFATPVPLTSSEPEALSVW